MKYGRRRNRRWRANSFPKGSRAHLDQETLRQVKALEKDMADSVFKALTAPPQPRRVVAKESSVRFYFNGIEITGFMDGTFLEIERDGSALDDDLKLDNEGNLMSEDDDKNDELPPVVPLKDLPQPRSGIRDIQFLRFDDPRDALERRLRDQSRYYGQIPPPARESDPRDLALQAAQMKLAQQDAFLKKISAASHMIGTVIDIRGDRMTVMSGGQFDIALFAGAAVGDVVALSAESMQAVSIIKDVKTNGVVATVQNVLGGDRIEIEYGGPRVVRTKVAVDVGDRVMCDASLSVVLDNLGKPKSLLAFEKTTGVTWDHVGGHEEAKRILVDAIETPTRHPELFLKYGRKPTKGVLLYGPPGTGKTLLAKAAATSLAKTHGHEGAAEGFIYVKGPSLLSKWVGESESSVRAIFSAARNHKKTHGYPALVFIDEAEAVLGRRGGSHNYVSQTLVPQFLAEMDGLEDSGALVLLATNRPGDLDPAVTREGRVDRKVLIGRPKKPDTERIAAIHLVGKPIAEDTDAASVAAMVAEILHSEEVGSINLPTITVPIFLSSFSSGSMIAAIVEAAAEQAFTRDLATGGFTGISIDDVRAAVKVIRNGLVGLDPASLADEILAENRDAIIASAGGEAPATAEAKVSLDKVSN